MSCHLLQSWLVLCNGTMCVLFVIVLVLLYLNKIVLTIYPFLQNCLLCRLYPLTKLFTVYPPFNKIVYYEKDVYCLDYNVLTFIQNCLMCKKKYCIDYLTFKLLL